MDTVKVAEGILYVSALAVPFAATVITTLKIFRGEVEVQGIYTINIYSNVLDTNDEDEDQVGNENDGIQPAPAAQEHEGN